MLRPLRDGSNARHFGNGAYHPVPPARVTSDWIVIQLIVAQSQTVNSVVIITQVNTISDTALPNSHSTGDGTVTSRPGGGRARYLPDVHLCVRADKYS
jgi:hypothetical protein